MKRTSLLFLCVTFSMITFGQLKINNLSNVGIGTTSPSAKLNLIENGKSATQTQFTQNITNAGVLITTQYLADTYTPGLFWNTSNNYSTKPKAGIYLKQTAAGTSMYFGTSNSLVTGITNSALVISPSGNIGIGIVDPTKKIDVHNSGTCEIRAYSTTQSAAKITAQHQNMGYSFGVDAVASTGYIQNSSGTNLMRFSSTGFFTIGGSSPLNDYKLKISSTNSSLYCGNTSNGEWTYNIVSNVYHENAKAFTVKLGTNDTDKVYICGSGWAYARNWVSTSDMRLKENVQSIGNSLHKIMQLRGISFNYKPEPARTYYDSLTQIAYTSEPIAQPTEIGLIAQEVELVIPEAVVIGDKGIRYLNYSSIVATLIEAIKEQQTEIENQSEKISKLETQIIDCCSIKPISNEKSLEMLHNPDNNSVQPQSIEAKPALFQNMPNPFKEKTVIKYFLPQTSNNASLIIFDMNGKLIKTYSITSNGEGSIQIFGGELQPGMYMYSLIANGSEIDTKRMILTE